MIDETVRQQIEAGAPGSVRRRTGATAVAAVVLLAGVGCSGSPKPVAPGPQAQMPASPPVDPSPAPVEPRTRTTVVIESAEDPQEPTLLEASRAAKEKQRSSPPSVAVINNDNLAEYAARGKLTFAQPGPREPAEEGEAAAAAKEVDESPVRGEEYWRNAVFEARLLWRQALDEIEDLERSAADLRRRFYDEDDPYLRDTRIKPRWDRVLDRLEQTRRDAERYGDELADLVEEGRRGGALPGWLREGIELEPEVEAPDPNALPEADIGEPVVVGGDGPP